MSSVLKAEDLMPLLRKLPHEERQRLRALLESGEVAVETHAGETDQLKPEGGEPVVEERALEEAEAWRRFREAWKRANEGRPETTLEEVTAIIREARDSR